MTGQVFEPGEWGRIFSGGASLEVDGAKVDLIYRDLDEVARWESEAIVDDSRSTRGWLSRRHGWRGDHLRQRLGVWGHEASLVNL